MSRKISLSMVIGLFLALGSSSAFAGGGDWGFWDKKPASSRTTTSRHYTAPRYFEPSSAGTHNNWSYRYATPPQCIPLYRLADGNLYWFGTDHQYHFYVR